MDQKRSTAELWRKRIVAQLASGMSIRAWCRDNEVREHAFYWWRTRLRLSPVGTRLRPRSSGAGRAKFAEVVVAPPFVAEPIRLRLRGDRELILPASMPMADVAALVRAIEGLPSTIEVPT
jgi:hypothetical protein